MTRVGACRAHTALASCAKAAATPRVYRSIGTQGGRKKRWHMRRQSWPVLLISWQSTPNIRG